MADDREPQSPAVRLVSAVRARPLLPLSAAVGVAAAVIALSGSIDAARVVLGVWCGIVVLVRAVTMLREWRRGHHGLDVLALLAIGAALAAGDPLAAVVVVIMLTGGEALEGAAENRARREMSALIDRVPRIAHRITPDAAEDRIEEVDVDLVRVGDVLAVHPGEVVPVDGRLDDDEAELDESALTGESLPVLRRRGETLSSGAVTGSAALRMTVTATAEASEYQQLVRLMAEAAGHRAPTVRWADRVSIPFTVTALAIAIAAGLLSGEPRRIAEVLVVATPCPLLIAAPVAFLAGTGAAARRGIIVKTGGALEALARARSAAFDKTGTLTLGSPEVARIEAQPGVAAAEVLQLAAALEARSGHVLAEAVRREAAARGIDVMTAHQVEERVAHGVIGRVGDAEIRVGKAAFVGPGAVAELDAGEMAVHVGRNGRPIGRIVLRDAVRPEAAGTVAWLRRHRIARVVMLTGDHESTARHVAAAVGIDEVRAGLVPEQKIEAVRMLQPRPVMMVGDGVNDAPVLASAEVGVAMGARGSTAAGEAADVVIMVDDLGRLTEAAAIARRTVRIALQSMIGGIAVSVLLMLVATTGVIPAILGALLQEALDLVTIGNGLRAVRVGPPTSADAASRDQIPYSSARRSPTLRE